MGKLWGDLCQDQDENWPRYNGTALYNYFMQISHVSCLWPSGCPCLFILNIRHNSIECISFARDLLVTVNPVSSPLMFSCFEIEIGFLKLTTIDVPSGLQTRNFPSSVIHHHEFSLIGKLNVYICETLCEKPRVKSPTSCNWGYLNFGR